MPSKESWRDAQRHRAKGPRRQLLYASLGKALSNYGLTPLIGELRDSKNELNFDKLLEYSLVNKMKL